MDTATIMYLVVEDKQTEQADALVAIKAALGIAAEDAGHRSPDFEPGSYFLGFMNAKVVVNFSASLDDAKRRIALLRQTNVPFGVLTDLMFTRTFDPKKADSKEKPYGLEVIAECIGNGIPVAVCSDTDHHDADYLRGIMPILGAAHPKGRIPVILDKKDWAKAFSLLQELMT